jgi:hypothetical protein
MYSKYQFCFVFMFVGICCTNFFFITDLEPYGNFVTKFGQEWRMELIYFSRYYIFSDSTKSNT